MNNPFPPKGIEATTVAYTTPPFNNNNIYLKYPPVFFTFTPPIFHIDRYITVATLSGSASDSRISPDRGTPRSVSERLIEFFI